MRMIARKPVQSFAPATTPTDADVLGDRRRAPHVVSPAPLARDGPAHGGRGARPPRSRSPTSLRRCGRQPARQGAVLVETAGGVRSPFAPDGDCVRSVTGSAALVVLVADAGLGTINLVRLSGDALSRTTSSSTSTASSRTRPCTSATRTGSAREGLEVVTDIEALAKLVCAPSATG